MPEEVKDTHSSSEVNFALNRRNILLGGASLFALTAAAGPTAQAQQPAATPAATPAGGGKPNILVIFGDDVGYWNISAYNRGMMGYRTPNIDRIAKEGAIFTDHYAQQSCTAGRAAFITGQSCFRTGLLKVGLPGAKEGLSEKDPTLADLLKAQGYATGQFGKNISAIAMSTCRRSTDSTNSSATSTTLTPRMNRRIPTTRRTPRSRPSSARAA